MTLLRRHSLEVGIDPDARAFILTYGIATPKERWAVNYRAIQYKKAGLWTKMICIYPLVKDVDTCKYSLKRNGLAFDFDLAYNNPALPTYTTQGLQFNGTYAVTNNLQGNNGAADPPKEWGGGSRLNQTAGFWSTYAETSTTDGDISLFGGTAAATSLTLRLAIRKGNLSLADQYGSTSRASYTPESDGLGLFSIGYNDAIVNTIWKNGVAMGSGLNSGVVGTSGINFGRTDTGTSTKKYGMFYISTRLTNAEHLLLYNIENSIQQSLRA